MNNVDLVDQRRKTSYTPRKERKLYMSFFHLILDYAINNAYALYRWAVDQYGFQEGIPKYEYLCSFKTDIGVKLCEPNIKKLYPIKN